MKSFLVEMLNSLAYSQVFVRDGNVSEDKSFSWVLFGALVTNPLSYSLVLMEREIIEFLKVRLFLS